MFDAFCAQSQLNGIVGAMNTNFSLISIVDQT